jgi:EAL domain-containing protein (putative c-di-GMP-specific phosphodiesterase class I)
MQLYYQPKVNMKTGEVIGVEALIRWIHPEKGLIPPLEFLPIIDGSEVEILLGEWVVERALRQLDLWMAEGLYFEVSVNISSYHLQSSRFISELTAILAKHKKIDSKYLQLEILESSALGDLRVVSDVIRASRNKLGVHIALDDFGTGYSSLAHLRNLPANTLKIDQSFVKDVLDDANDYAIIDGIIQLAAAFNREVIAEGVESIEHGIMLLLMGCELAQGYAIAKPMPANEVSGWVEKYQPNQQWKYYAAIEHTSTESKLKMFQLCLESWYQLILKTITLEANESMSWSEMSRKKCHHGVRFKYILLEQLVSPELIDEIKLQYELMQSTAQEIYDKYNNGEVADALDKLNALQESYQIVCTLLEGVESNNNG